MQISITCERSEEFCRRESLRCRENIHRRFEAIVDVSELSTEVCEKLLEYAGKFTSIKGFGVDVLGKLDRTRRGDVYPHVDELHPSVETIDLALSNLFRRQEENYMEHKLRKRRREREKLVAKRRRAQAEELLSRELTELVQLRADRTVLAEFLRQIPQDALVGTVKRLAGEPGERQKIIDEIEAASPLTIFE